MRKLLVTGIAAAALTSVPALAADMPVKAPMAVAPVYSWTGWYAGANGGYGWQDPSSVDLFSTVVPGVLLMTTPGFDAQGGFGGGQIGYNIQSGQIVYGLEADFQGAAIRDRFSVPANGGFFNPGAIFNGRSDLDWFGTVRGRLGLASNQALFYVTGGFAYGKVSEEVQGNVAGIVFYDISRSGTLAGFVVGGGLEWALAPSWSLKAEYQFIDLGDKSLSGPNAGFTGFSNNIDHNYHTVRLGLNYKFGSN